MKKTAAALIIASTIIITACSTSNQDNTSLPNTAAELTESTVSSSSESDPSPLSEYNSLAKMAFNSNSVKSAGLMVEKNDSIATITIPKDLFGDYTEAEMVREQKDFGAFIAYANDDGSVTAKFRLDDYAQILEDSKLGLDTEIENSLSNYPQYKTITYNDEVNYLKATYDKSELAEEDILILLSVLTEVPTYQVFNGVADSDIYAECDIISEQTNEVLYHIDTRQ